MEIEILTTQKKLTKSIISQMLYADYAVMKYGEAIGYIINAMKGSHKIALFKHGNEYYYIDLNWTKGESVDPPMIYRKVGGGFSTSKKFNTQEEKDQWWKVYEDVKKEIEKKHIYI